MEPPPDLDRTVHTGDTELEQEDCKQYGQKLGGCRKCGTIIREADLQKDPDDGKFYGATDGRGEVWCTQEDDCEREFKRRTKEAKAAKNSKPKSNPNPNPNSTSVSPNLPIERSTDADIDEVEKDDEIGTIEGSTDAGGEDDEDEEIGTIEGSTDAGGDDDEDEEIGSHGNGDILSIPYEP
jgi:hypothetical protein